MVQVYADNRYVLENTHVLPSTISSRVRRFLKYGYIKEEKKPRLTGSFGSDFWLVRPTPRGIQYLKKHDAAEVVRALIRVERLNCAILWIYGYINSLSELPEFITHIRPQVRTAANARFEILARKQS